MNAFCEYGEQALMIDDSLKLFFNNHHIQAIKFMFLVDKKCCQVMSLLAE